MPQMGSAASWHRCSMRDGPPSDLQYRPPCALPLLARKLTQTLENPVGLTAESERRGLTRCSPSKRTGSHRMISRRRVALGGAIVAIIDVAAVDDHAAPDKDPIGLHPDRIASGGIDLCADAS